MNNEVLNRQPFQCRVMQRARLHGLLQRPECVRSEVVSLKHRSTLRHHMTVGAEPHRLTTRF